MIMKRAYARMGLAGNPSDCFYGKTLSCCISNFHAEVILVESHRLRFIPHEIHDPMEFGNLGKLAATPACYGYYGGLRLIYATCKYFRDYCLQQEIPLHARNFTVRYDTNIPRQVGLGGSSAIISSLLKALMEFYELTAEHIPLEIQPNIVREVETVELSIDAGLQDRVIQIYGGLVFMDFSRGLMESTGYGKYLRMSTCFLPNFFLAYMDSPGKVSGKVHNKMRFRFDEGDYTVLSAMATFAGYAEAAKQALEVEDMREFGILMDRNFDLRRLIYGEEAVSIGLEMVELGRQLGAHVKFPGSGGAVVGTYGSEDHYQRLLYAYNGCGYKFTKVVVHSAV